MTTAVLGPQLPTAIHRDRPLPSVAVPARPAQQKQFGSFEGLDNRRDLWRMLQRLERLSDGVAPEVGCARRREFFRRCCVALAKKTGLNVEVDPKTVGFVNETYHDIIALCMIPGWLDIETVAKSLEHYVRKECGL